MKRKTNAHTEVSASIAELVSEIRKEQQKIDRCEGDIVASHIRLGYHLAQLRQLANNDWAKQLIAIGMSPRVASRYLRISKCWPSEIGLKGNRSRPGEQ